MSMSSASVSDDMPSASASRNRRFDPVPLQRGIRCELDLGEGGFADEIAAASPGDQLATREGIARRYAVPDRPVRDKRAVNRDWELHFRNTPLAAHSATARLTAKNRRSRWYQGFRETASV